MGSEVTMHLVNNLFLPRQLPQKAEPSSSAGAFVRLAAQVLAGEELQGEDVDVGAGMAEAARAMRVWARVQEELVGWMAVQEGISALRPGQTFALYVRAQNAGVLLSIPKEQEESATVAVFQVAARNAKVVEAKGDLTGIFPGWAVTCRIQGVQNACFAKQLADLANTAFEDETLPMTRKAGTQEAEIRDVADAKYVTEWLLSAVAGHSEITGGGGVARVRKKIRDDVLWKDALLPWRRSGEYMTVKIALHSMLVGSLGPHEGFVAYKMTMLQMLTLVLTKNYAKLETDVLMEMLGKLARRVSKLEQYLSASIQTTHSDFHRRLQKVTERSCKSVVHVRAVVDKRWERIASLRSPMAPDTQKLDFAKHQKHSLETAIPHLQRALAAPQSNSAMAARVVVPKCLERSDDFAARLRQFTPANSSVEIGEVLYDFECWARESLWARRNIMPFHQTICHMDVLIHYIELAKGFYQGDILGLSRLILTAYTIVAVIDCISARQYPLLLQYDPGVSTPVLEALLLPLRQDMEHLSQLEAYFAWRVARKLRDISLISEDEPSPQSLSVRLAQQDFEMQRIKQEILDFATKKQIEKLEELARLRVEYNRLNQEADNMTCSTYTDRYGHENHCRWCSKCDLIKLAAKMSVSIFEFPLPDKLHLQDAVVYEIVAPASLLVLRDALHILSRDVCCVQLSCKRKQGMWLSHAPLKRWCSACPYERLTTLCSTNKLFAQSHYSMKHPSRPDEDFIKPNGFNVCFMECAGTGTASVDTHKKVADVTSLTTMTVDGPYQCLQWTIEGTSHTENEVLAKQVQCPAELSLVEYKAFGTLRSGHRHQIRNMTRVLEMRSLSLSQPSVAKLLSQALWQAGPAAAGKDWGGWWRESHVDLRDKLFARYFMDQLKSLAESMRENWKAHLSLLSIVNIGARLLAMSEAAWEQDAADILHTCRAIAEDWLDRMKRVLGRMMASPIHELQKFHSNLVDVAAIAALTFDVDVCHMELVLRDNANATSWLQAVACIQDNVILNTKMSGGLLQHSLLRRVQITALRLEKPLAKLMTMDSECLDTFVSKHWVDANQGEIEGWEQCEIPQERWWTCEFKHTSSGRKMVLQMDMLGGSFLVDGCPVARLPSSITSHEDYQRLFGSHVFQVQAAAASRGTFVSIHKLHNANFTFAMDEERLLVTERREDGRRFKLFPSRFLKGDLPRLLIEQHSHWILEVESCSGLKKSELPELFGTDIGCMVFRPVRFDDETFSGEKGDVFPYVLDIRSGIVYDTQKHRNLVDLRSDSFREIYDKMLCRLELSEYVHVFAGKNGVVSAELPRLGLSFYVDKSGAMESRERPGYIVSQRQTLGTLIGLHHGLVLEELGPPKECTGKCILLIPHSTPLVTTMGCHGKFERHPSVRVTLTSFSSPSFFFYHIDNRLQCLQGPASTTAWLYLALLHASTSHALPDPFTGLTGTESAMRLLQSARCWSCKPYDPEALSVLFEIAKLSPIREWYPRHLHSMQTVSWPNAMFSVTSLDGFLLVVKNLIDSSERLRVLFPGLSKSPGLPTGDVGLLLKSYWRSRETSGKEVQMIADIETSFGGPPTQLSASINLSSQEVDRFVVHQTVRSLAEAGLRWRCVAISQRGLLHSLLLERATLCGVTGKDFFSKNPTVSSWRKISENFADVWLDLYNHARQVSKQHQRDEFTLFLSLLAYCGVEAEQLFVLLCVAVQAAEFQHLNPPKHTSYIETIEADFDSNKVKSSIDGHALTQETWEMANSRSMYSGETEDMFSKRKGKEYRKTFQKDIMDLVNLAESAWPFTVHFPTRKTIDSSSATKAVNSLITRWRENLELHKFVLRVEERVWNVSKSKALNGQPPVVVPCDDITMTISSRRFCFPMPNCTFTDLSFAEVEPIFQSGQWGRTIGTEHNARKVDCVPLEMPKFPLRMDETTCEVSKKFDSDLRESWRVHQAERNKLKVEHELIVSRHTLVEKLRLCKIKSTSLWADIHATMEPCSDPKVICRNRFGSATGMWTSQAWEAAGLWPRVVPVVLLPCIVTGGDALEGYKGIELALGALAVIWTLEQQAERCLHFLDAGNDMALRKELRNHGHSNWSPKRRPDWLLLELEGDFLIRPIQIDVMHRMLCPMDNKSAVLQLNMGEGKTSVIVPALCLSIPDGHQFARLTVLGSLYRTNFDGLAFKLGGLLNRRIYTFPCWRDMRVNAKQVEVMRRTYQECIDNRGVVVTRPEDRLSAALKVLELCRAGPTAGPASEFRNVQNWVNSSARDVLDESDWILHVKYQLVYTIGEQKTIDGGSLRWVVSQSVLRSACRHFVDIRGQFGVDAIEYEAASEGSFVFPHVRLLKEEANVVLCEMIADDILAGRDDSLPLRELRQVDTCTIREFILPCSNTHVPVSLARIHEILSDEQTLNTVLILRGLLCYGVLLYALRFRWRVQFGVRPFGQTKMAVPFRAKDRPVERAEFGHPDVAIMLTQLTYYNSGLSDEMLLDAFARLMQSSNSEFEYSRWLEGLPAELVPSSIRTLSGINLNDSVQTNEKLNPILRKNMRVIDFWLANAVFPTESKQFEKKLVASAWDLCCHSAEGRPVTGFSGTKDTNLLLPASIRQHDMDELQGTDGAVIENLLREENSCYSSLQPCVSSSEILQKVVASNSRVLLDVGALMVEWSNQEVAGMWLRMLVDESTIEAAIYFDDDQIMTINREGQRSPLPLSPYHQKMQHCIVYLDDVHTRGTDLKMPRNYHACVTLGSGITKDRLVQACMRMRMLGEGQSVSFWASQEVHKSILSLLPPSPNECKLTSADVLYWATQNSVKTIKEGLRFWGSQGLSHCRKQAVNSLYTEQISGDSSLQLLGHLSAENEVTMLSDFYGGERTVLPLPTVTRSQLESVAKSLQECFGSGFEAHSTVLRLGHDIIKRIDQYGGAVECFAQVLDEEQERELEQDLEEEREIYRPGEATPHQPFLSPHVRRLATDGYFDPSSSSDFLPLLEALECTLLWKRAESGAWSDKIFVTRDFVTVLDDTSESTGGDFCVQWPGSPLWESVRQLSF